MNQDVELLETPEPRPSELPPEHRNTADGTPAKPQMTERERELTRELKNERRARQEAESGLRHWYDRATKVAQPQQPEPEPEPEIDVIDAITTDGAKGLDKALQKLGYVKAKDVDSKIGQTRAEVTQEAQLVAQYPDLADEQSEFYQTTLEIYKDLASDPTMRQSPALLEKAARQAARVFGIEEKPARGRRAAEPDLDDDEEEERERVQRVSRQSGDRGRRPSREPEGDELDGMQKSIVAKFRAAGADITEDGYKKRASRGIQMSGLPTRRRR